MQDDNAASPGWEALSLRLTYGDPCSRGISVGRLEAIGRDLHELASVDGPPELDPLARRTLRYLCTLVHEDVPDTRLPDVVCQLANNRALPLDVVREIIRGEGWGEGREVAGATLRRVARRLTAGDSLEAAAAAESVSVHIAGQVSQWLGVEEARTEALEMAAAEWVHSAGGSAASFARTQGIGAGRAGQLIRDARVAAGLPASEKAEKERLQRQEMIRLALEDADYWSAA